MSRLPIALEGCCAGHACDGCVKCRGGHCCRRDNPAYQLPQLGEWPGPLYVPLGEWADHGAAVTCAACGGDYRHLGNHVWRAHDLTADEYRALFGLKRQQGLMASDAAARLAAYRRRELEQHTGRFAPGVPPLPVPTPEQRSQFSRGKTWRLAQRKEVDATGRNQRVSEGQRRNWANNPERHEALHGWIHTPEAHAARGRVLRGRVKGPEWRAKLSAAHGGRHTALCEGCKQAFQYIRSDPHRFCSWACYVAARRQGGAK